MRAFGDESLVLEVRPRGTAYILGAVVLSEQAVVQAREAVPAMCEGKREPRAPPSGGNSRGSLPSASQRGG